MTNLYDAIVIGGGQSGLAAGYYLQKAGVRFLILEASAQATGSWEHHYDSLHLFSPAKHSSMPEFLFSGDSERYPSKNEVIAYLKAFAEQFKLPIVMNAPVLSVNKNNDEYIIETEDVTYHAKSVISATGGFRNPYLPEIKDAQLFSGKTLHSFAYKNSEPFRKKRVVVVGAGNSAVQIAHELADTAVVTLATREPVHFQKQRILGKDIHFWMKWTTLDIFPKREAPQRGLVIDSGGFQEALNAGKYDQKQMFGSFYEDGVVWADGQQEAVDAVIFATGFRPNVDYLAELDVLDENGRIQQNKGISISTPGLYFVGIPFQRNLASATLRGAGPDAKYVINHMLKRRTSSSKAKTTKTPFNVWQRVKESYCAIFCSPSNITKN